MINIAYAASSSATSTLDAVFVAWTNSFPPGFFYAFAALALVVLLVLVLVDEWT